MEEGKPVKLENIWKNKDGTFKKGHPPIGGRPKGKTLKEYAREYLMNLPDEEKTEYLASLPSDIVWKMAEGNPDNKTDFNNMGNPIIVLSNEVANKYDTPQSTSNDS